ncbi:Uncharacterised protein [Mycobacteroides abscessus subsp. abscessus]|nr:Uncharacterised protein [Mycobacteroides abscessus subsp. abscessus]
MPSATIDSGPTPSSTRWRASVCTRAANSPYDRLVPSKVSATVSGVRAACASNIETRVASVSTGRSVAFQRASRACSAVRTSRSANEATVGASNMSAA